MTKKCQTCKVEKPLTAFHKRTRSKDGRAIHCKVCKPSRKLTPEENHAHYLANKEKHLLRVYAWNKANPEKFKKYQKTYRQKVKRGQQPHEPAQEP